MEDRYSRQVKFSEIGVQGQKKLEKTTAAVVGVGGLGSISAELLTRAGIGKLILFDPDKVEYSNLQRQSLYTEEDVGKNKSIAAAKHLKKINSNVKIESFEFDIAKDNINFKADIIIDGTDNMDTRYLLNEFAVEKKIPFVYGSAAGADGIVFNVLPNRPCLKCILKNAKDFQTANTVGIINPITHLVAATQITETLKIILNKNPSKNLIRFNPWKNTYNTFKVKKNPDCDVCS